MTRRAPEALKHQVRGADPTGQLGELFFGVFIRLAKSWQLESMFALEADARERSELVDPPSLVRRVGVTAAVGEAEEWRTCRACGCTHDDCSHCIAGLDGWTQLLGLRIETHHWLRDVHERRRARRTA